MTKWQRLFLSRLLPFPPRFSSLASIGSKYFDWNPRANFSRLLIFAGYNTSFIHDAQWEFNGLKSTGIKFTPHCRSAVMSILRTFYSEHNALLLFPHFQPFPFKYHLINDLSFLPIADSREQIFSKAALPRKRNRIAKVVNYNICAQLNSNFDCKPKTRY